MSNLLSSSKVGAVVFLVILFDRISRNHCVRCKRILVHRTGISRIIRDDAVPGMWRDNQIPHQAV